MRGLALIPAELGSAAVRSARAAVCDPQMLSQPLVQAGAILICRDFKLFLPQSTFEFQSAEYRC